MIKKTLPPFVKGIYRADGRIVEIRLKTGDPIKNISILNTYAPHIGYPTDTMKEYWEYIAAYTSLIPNNLVKIWRTDNNGQLSQNETNKKYIGKWTMGNRLGNINSQNLSKNCGNNELVARNTHFPLKNTIRKTLRRGTVMMLKSRNNWITFK